MNWAVKEVINFELKKHVNAIHCTNSLSLVQRKLFNALLFNAYPDLLYKQQFQIFTKDLCKLIGYNSNDYAGLKQALLGLITIAIEWNVLSSTSGKESKWKASSILASAELANGICVYEYSKTMKELLYQPEIYGRLKMDLIAKFKSGYGLALYENCVRYQGLPQTPWFSVPIFRKLMGVSDEKYREFKDFKKRVIDIAIKEVNSLSSLTLVLEVERLNQKVNRIRFKLCKEKKLDELTFSETANEELKNIIVNTFGLSQYFYQEILTQYGESYIQQKVNFILHSSSFKEGKIRGLAGYLIEALKKDYQANKSSQSISVEARKKREEEEKKSKEQADKRKEHYSTYINNKIDIYMNSLTKQAHEDFFKKFETYIQPTLIIGFYRKYGLEHAGVRAYLYEFISKEKLLNLLTYEDFIALIEDDKASGLSIK